MRPPPSAHRSPSTPPPRRLLEGGGSPHLTRLLAAAARPMVAPRAMCERVVAHPLGGRRRGAWRTALAAMALGAGATAALMVWFWGWGANSTLRRQTGTGTVGGPATTLAEVIAVSGPGQLARAETAPVPLTAGARIGDGETVWAQSEPLAIVLPSLKVKLAAGSGATFHGRAAGGLDIGLMRGEIHLDVGRRAPGQPLVVTARDYQIQVVGTVFTVRAPANGGAIEVFVSEGLVHVRGQATDRHLHPGDRWSSATLAAPTAGATPAEKRATEAAPDPEGNAAVAGAAPASAKRAAEDRAPAPKATMRPLALRSAASQHRDAEQPGGGGRVAGARASSAPADPSTAIPGSAVISTPGAAVDAPAGAAAALSAPPTAAIGTEVVSPPDPSAAVAPAVAPAPPPPSEVEVEQTRYRAAQALAAEGRYKEAADALGRLAAGDGSRAELALFDRGELLLRHLRDPGQAAQVFAEHRRRFPRASLRPDADLSLVEALLAGGHLDRAAQQIEHFLATHPRSERRDEVRLMRAHLHREQGNWVRARDDYERLTATRGATAEEALYFAAYCRRQLGDTAGARQTLERYLVDFPQGRYARAAREALGVAR